jgi:hypothetical protein
MTVYIVCGVIVVSAMIGRNDLALASLIVGTSVAAASTQFVWTCNNHHPALYAATGILLCCTATAIYAVADPGDWTTPALNVAGIFELVGIAIMAWHIGHAIHDAQTPDPYLWTEEDDTGTGRLVDLK